MRLLVWTIVWMIAVGAAVGQTSPVTKAATVNPTNKVLLFPTADEFGEANSFLRYLYGDSTISVTRSGTTARLHAAGAFTNYLTKAAADLLYSPIGSGGGGDGITQEEADLRYQPIGDYVRAADVPDYLEAYVPTQGPVSNKWKFQFYDAGGELNEYANMYGVGGIWHTNGGRGLSLSDGSLFGGWQARGQFGFYSAAGDTNRVSFNGVAVDFSAADGVYGLPPSGVSGIDDVDPGDVISGLSVDDTTLVVRRSVWPSSFMAISATSATVSGEVAAASVKHTAGSDSNRWLTVRFDGTNAIFDSEATGAYSGMPRPMLFRLQGTNRFAVDTGGAVVHGNLAVDGNTSVAGTMSLGGDMIANGAVFSSGVLVQGDLVVTGTFYQFATVNWTTNVNVGVTTTYVYSTVFSTQILYQVIVAYTNRVTTNNVETYVNDGGSFTMGAASTFNATNAAQVLFPTFSSVGTNSEFTGRIGFSGAVVDGLPAAGATNIAAGSSDSFDAEKATLTWNTDVVHRAMASADLPMSLASFADTSNVVLSTTSKLWRLVQVGVISTNWQISVGSGMPTFGIVLERSADEFAWPDGVTNSAPAANSTNLYLLYKIPGGPWRVE